MGAESRVGLIGAGSWGRNYLRVLSQLGALQAVCDSDPGVTDRISSNYPALRVSLDAAAVLADEELDAVVIAAPAATHYELARTALEAGKHCLLEKPLASSAAQAADLCRLATERGLVLMAAHIMVHHPAIRELKKLVDQGYLGEIYYLSAIRANLGLIRRAEGVLSSLAPHDISVARYLLGANPISVSATAGSYVQRDTGMYDVASLSLEFRGGARAHISVSWLDPEKVRSIKLVGSQRMALFDDMQPRYKLQIHEKGVDWTQFNDAADGSFLQVRSGDVKFPFVAPDEPLFLECQDFLGAIAEKRTPLTPGEDGLAVARTIEAAETSITRGGSPVALAD